MQYFHGRDITVCFLLEWSFLMQSTELETSLVKSGLSSSSTSIKSRFRLYYLKPGKAHYV